jgi:hypothetical protein
VTETDAAPRFAWTTEARFRWIFGTIIIMAALGSTRAHLRESERLLEILVTVAATLIVVHTFADYLARRFDFEARPTLGDLRDLVREELPLVAGAVVPCGMYILASLDVLGEGLAYWVSMGSGLIFLFLAGYLAVRATATMRRVVSGGLFLLVGALVVGLEAGLH